MTNKKDRVGIWVVLLLVIVSVAGILSWNLESTFSVMNQYGESIRMWGYGIYARDSYFKVPIFIGTDVSVLLLLVPMLVYHLGKYKKENSDINRLKLMSLYGVTTYYAASLALGITYNRLVLVYIILFALSLYATFYHGIRLNLKSATATRGVKIFMIISGVALLVAWLPDMIPTIIKGSTLPLIEVYTTEITYVLDMGIISPMCFICLYLMKNKNVLGTVLAAFLFRICFVVGVMMITQAVFQVMSGVDLPLPAILTKSASFLVLGGFAFYFQRKLYKEITE